MNPTDAQSLVCRPLAEWRVRPSVVYCSFIQLLFKNSSEDMGPMVSQQKTEQLMQPHVWLSLPRKPQTLSDPKSMGIFLKPSFLCVCLCVCVHASVCMRVIRWEMLVIAAGPQNKSVIRRVLVQECIFFFLFSLNRIRGTTASTLHSNFSYFPHVRMIPLARRFSFNDVVI